MQKSTVNEMWNLFKNNLTKSINKNIPHKMLTYKHRLPWIHNKHFIDDRWIGY
jgi:hypothetical protein